MEEILKCPNCKSTHIHADTFHDTYQDGNKKYYSYGGFCVNCKTRIEWEEVFQLEGYKISN